MIIEFTQPGAGNAGHEVDELGKLVTYHNTSNLVDLNEFALKKAERESLTQRRKSGLLTKGELAADYESIRKPRGNYRVPLPEDLIDGR